MKAILIAGALLCSSGWAMAQHDHHNMPKDTVMAKENHTAHKSTADMSHAFSLNLPMNRNGSGTGWLPDASPMYGYMFHKRKWMFMLHGNIFLRYIIRTLPMQAVEAMLK